MMISKAKIRDKFPNLFKILNFLKPIYLLNYGNSIFYIDIALIYT
jgi:hypothetical protein